MDLIFVFKFLNGKMQANVCVYEPLRGQSAYLSRYTEVTKRTDLRKPTTSNGLYTLLATVIINYSRLVFVDYQIWQN